MTDLLEDCGTALYGADWKSPLARALGVTDRTVRRWATGASPIPATAWGDIAALVADRRSDLATLRDRIAATSGG